MRSCPAEPVTRAMAPDQAGTNGARPVPQAAMAMRFVAPPPTPPPPVLQPPVTQVAGQASQRPAYANPEICPPDEIAARVCRWSEAKTGLPLGRLVVLGLLAGVYIGFGCALFLMVMSDSAPGLGHSRWIGGVAFSLGLVLVVVGGAELSTGNCLMALARGAGRITSAQIGHNLAVSFAANAVGAVVLAWAIVASGVLDPAPVRATAVRIAEAKLALPVGQALLRGILANALVCLAVWLTLSTQTVIGKLVGIIFPISAFVALGFEHSIANFFLLPAGLMLGASGTLSDLAVNLAVGDGRQPGRWRRLRRVCAGPRPFEWSRSLRSAGSAGVTAVLGVGVASRGPVL